MTSHKATVMRYIDSFRRTDHDAILECLTDDVIWVIHGYKTISGKAAIDPEIENDAAVAGTLELDRLVEEGDTVVAVGHGTMTLKEGGTVAFVFNEVFTFTNDLVARIETFHINLDSNDSSMFGTNQ